MRRYRSFLSLPQTKRAAPFSNGFEAARSPSGRRQPASNKGPQPAAGFLGEPLDKFGGGCRSPARPTGRTVAPQSAEQTNGNPYMKAENSLVGSEDAMWFLALLLAQIPLPTTCDGVVTELKMNPPAYGDQGRAAYA
jgi:hypothetical protein